MYQLLLSKRYKFTRQIKKASPVGYWTLGESGGTVVNDLTANNLDGGSTGVTAGVPGRIGLACAFDGGTSKIQIGDNALLDITDDLTVLSVMRMTNPTGYRPIMAKRNSGTVNYSYHISDSADDGKMAAYNGTTSVGSDGTVSANAWHFLAYVRSGTNLIFYKDGASIGTIGHSLGPANNHTLNIGIDNGGAFFLGTMQHVALYSKALTANEILKISKKGRFN